jgi:hypothetical protein
MVKPIKRGRGHSRSRVGQKQKSATGCNTRKRKTPVAASSNPDGRPCHSTNKESLEEVIPSNDHDKGGVKEVSLPSRRKDPPQPAPISVERSLPSNRSREFRPYNHGPAGATYSHAVASVPYIHGLPQYPIYSPARGHPPIFDDNAALASHGYHHPYFPPYSPLSPNRAPVYSGWSFSPSYLRISTSPSSILFSSHRPLLWLYTISHPTSTA